MELIDSINNCDYIFNCKKKKIYIKFAFIPSNSCVTINCKNTWSLTWGGNPKCLGRVYPNQRYLNELYDFLNMDVGIENTKLVVLYKHTEKIMKYINECEMELVSSKDNAYGIKVLTFDNLQKNFIDIL